MTITLLVTTERLQKDYITLGESAKMQRGDVDTMINVMAKFLIDPATNDFYPVQFFKVEYVEEEGVRTKKRTSITEQEADDEDECVILGHPEAIDRISNIRPSKIKDLAKEFQSKLRDGAVPLARGTR